jgi:hypothetical protein
MMYINSQPIKYKRIKWGKKRYKKTILVDPSYHDKHVTSIIKVGSTNDISSNSWPWSWNWNNSIKKIKRIIIKALKKSC